MQTASSQDGSILTPFGRAEGPWTRAQYMKVNRISTGGLICPGTVPAYGVVHRN
jgi:hypothetical protein